MKAYSQVKYKKHHITPTSLSLYLKGLRNVLRLRSKKLKGLKTTSELKAMFFVKLTKLGKGFHFGVVF